MADKNYIAGLRTNDDGELRIANLAWDDITQSWVGMPLGLTNTELRAAPVVVSLANTTVTNTVAVSGTVAVTGGPVSVSGTVGISGTVPVSGTVSLSPLVTGRTDVCYYASEVSSGSSGSETAIALTRAFGTAATTTGTSFTVTNGKRFRITSFNVSTRGALLATTQSTTFNLRVNTGGAVTTGSTPIVLQARCATPGVASAFDRFQMTLADGFELVGTGTLQFGLTANATYLINPPTWDVSIVGYEY